MINTSSDDFIQETERRRASDRSSGQVVGVSGGRNDGTTGSEVLDEYRKVDKKTTSTHAKPP